MSIINFYNKLYLGLCYMMSFTVQSSTEVKKTNTQTETQNFA